MQIQNTTMTLNGVLVPYGRMTSRIFKLETVNNEYLLRIPEFLLPLAKKLEWEDVKVRGIFKESNKVFEVEKIISRRNNYDSPAFPRMNWRELAA